MKALKFIIFLAVASALLFGVYRMVAPKSIDTLEGLKTIDNLDEHRSRVGHYAAMFSNGWNDTAFMNARLYIEGCRLNVSDSLMLSNLFASHCIESLHSFVKRRYGRIDGRQPLSGIRDLSAAYSGIENQLMPLYPSISSSDHYSKIMNNRRFYLSAYSYGRYTSGAWEDFACSYADGRVAHNLGHYNLQRELSLQRSKAREIERMGTQCDPEVASLAWIKAEISPSAVDAKCRRIESDYNRARQQAVRSFLAKIPTSLLRSGELYDRDSHVTLANAITEFENECRDFNVVTRSDFDRARDRIAVSARTFN